VKIYATECGMTHLKRLYVEVAGTEHKTDLLHDDDSAEVAAMLRDCANALDPIAAPTPSTPAPVAIDAVVHMARQQWQHQWTYTSEQIAERFAAPLPQPEVGDVRDAARVQRWKPHGVGGFSKMVSDNNGKYVKYSDLLALLASSPTRPGGRDVREMRIEHLELIAEEYNALIRHMEGGGDFYEFLAERLNIASPLTPQDQVAGDK